MRPSIFLLLALFLGVSSSACLAFADKVEEEIKQLGAAVAADIQARQPNREDRGHLEENHRQFQKNLKIQLDSPWMLGCEEHLDHIRRTNPSENVEKIIATLKNKIGKERMRRESAALTEMRDVLSRSGAAVKEVRKAADLDIVIEDLKNLGQREQNNTSQELRELYIQTQHAYQFVLEWQSYLVAKQSGDSQHVAGLLQNLRNTLAPSFLPRSEILVLIQAAKDKESKAIFEFEERMEAILADTKTPDEIESALKRLKGLQTGAQTNLTLSDNLNGLIHHLGALNQCYQNYKTGLAAEVDITQTNSLSVMDDSHLARLRSAVLLSVLPRYIGASEDVRAHPRENVSSFLNRVANEAKARGDVMLSARSRHALELLQRGGSFNRADLTGLGAFISGQNQETAGQFMLAVVSYQNSLKSGSDLVPSKLIGARLNAIKAAHPEQYEAGMKEFLHPSRSRAPEPDYFSRSRSGANPGGGQQKIGLLIPPLTLNTGFASENSSTSQTAPPAQTPVSAPVK